MFSGFDATRHRSGRAAVVIIGVVAAAIVAALAWFSEPLGMMVKLQMWDKGAPVKVVRSFFDAVSKGDQAAADRLLEVKGLEPVTKKGKWVGYRQPIPVVGYSYFDNAKMVPKQFPAQPRVEYMTMERGAADVFVPNAAGKEGRFRLERNASGWIITELGGGHLPTK